MPTEQATFLVSAPFLIHQRGLVFECLSCGHRNGKEIVPDELTIIGVTSRPFDSACHLEMTVPERIRCERRIMEYFPDVVKAALRAREKQDLGEGCPASRTAPTGQEA